MELQKIGNFVFILSSHEIEHGKHARYQHYLVGCCSLRLNNQLGCNPRTEPNV